VLFWIGLASHLLLPEIEKSVFRNPWAGINGGIPPKKVWQSKAKSPFSESIKPRNGGLKPALTSMGVSNTLSFP
jgi:hypothetical protein